MNPSSVKYLDTEERVWGKIDKLNDIEYCKDKCALVEFYAIGIELNFTWKKLYQNRTSYP